jgi:hypothetical protein
MPLLRFRLRIHTGCTSLQSDVSQGDRIFKCETSESIVRCRILMDYCWMFLPPCCPRGFGTLYRRYRRRRAMISPICPTPIEGECDPAALHTNKHWGGIFGGSPNENGCDGEETVPRLAYKLSIRWSLVELLVQPKTSNAFHEARTISLHYHCRFPSRSSLEM